MILSIWNTSLILVKKKGSPVHVASACAGSEEVSDHFVSYVRSISVFLQEAVLQDLTHDLMVTRQQLYRCAGAPLHFTDFGAYEYLTVDKQRLSFC
jgi:hypothetical protein